MNDNWVPHDKRLHCGCGFVFGGTVSALLLLDPILRGSLAVWLLVAVAAFLSAFLAMRHGEVFWARLSSIIDTLHRWTSWRGR